MQDLEKKSYSAASIKDDRDDVLIYKSINTKSIKRVLIFGVPLHNVTRDEATACILEAIEQQKGAFHVFFMDPLKLLKTRLSSRLRPIAAKSQLNLAEGSGLLWAARIMGRPLKERISKIALTMDIMRLALHKDLSVYFLGSKKEYLERVFFNFQRSFPGVRIIGRQEGYFGKKREALVKESLRKSSPNIIFLAYNFPEQELWLKENIQYFPSSVVIGIDDTFEILAGMRKKYPNWVQNRGLHWLWHSLRHPWHIYNIFLSLLFYGLAFTRSLKMNKKEAPSKAGTIYKSPLK